MSRPSINPVAWSAPMAPPRAKQRRSATPFPPARLITLPAPSEDVVIDSAGRLVCGLSDGRVVRVDSAGRVEQIGDTGGHPLGLEVAPDGAILVCDSDKGLLRLDPESEAIEVLVASIDGQRLRFCSNAVAASDGTVWFTESSSRFDFEHYTADVLEHSGAGRLFRRDADGTVDVVLTGLQFANGVALTADESAVVVAETAGYQLSRVPTSGPSAGAAREVVATNLPGMPDNISRAPDGTVWAAMVTPRNPILDSLSSRPRLRKLAWAIPPALQPKPKRTVWLMSFRVDGGDRGAVVHDLQTERDDFHFVTGVVESNGRLYCASLQIPAILEIQLPGGV